MSHEKPAKSQKDWYELTQQLHFPAVSEYKVGREVGSSH